MTGWFEEVQIALSPGWVGAAVGLILTIASSSLSVYLYFRQRQLSRLTIWAAETFAINALDGPAALPDLSIRYRDRVVPNVAGSAIAFWNSGTSTLAGSQIVDSDPLRIEIMEGREILDVHIEASKRNVIGASVDIAECRAKAIVKFDFLDPKDAFIVRMIYVGTPDDFCWVHGTLRGLPAGPQIYNNIRKIPQRQTILLALASALTLTGTIYLILGPSPTEKAREAGILMSVIVAILFLIVGIIVWIFGERKVPGIVDRHPFLGSQRSW